MPKATAARPSSCQRQPAATRTPAASQLDRRGGAPAVRTQRRAAERPIWHARTINKRRRPHGLSCAGGCKRWRVSLSSAIVRVDVAGFGPNVCGFVGLAELPQHFAKMRRDVAAAIVRIGGPQDTSPPPRVALAETTPSPSYREWPHFCGAAAWARSMSLRARAIPWHDRPGCIPAHSSPPDHPAGHSKPASIRATPRRRWP